jgi:hypothetical protein
MKLMRIIIGLAVCVGLAAAPWLALRVRAAPAVNGAEQPAISTALWHYWTGTRRTVLLQFAKATEVAVGDPIFMQDRPGSLRQVGEIQSLADSDGHALAYRFADVPAAQALFYPFAPQVGANAHVQYHTTPSSLAWVVNTLVTPERKEQLTREFKKTLDEHRDEILKLLAPVVDRSLQDMVAILAEDLPRAVLAHEKELDALGAKYERELVDRQLLPLVKHEIWPLVKARTEPEVRAVGQELWQRVSLWSFGWRYAYDKLPFTAGNRTDQEWQRFLEKEALPIIERHSEAFVGVVRNVVADVAGNPRVREAARKSLAVVADDPEFKRIVRAIFDEAILRNPRFREALERQWQSVETQAALEQASSILEPAIRRMTDVLIGSPDTGVTPEFAQVLRSQILAKDRRWFLLEVPQKSTAVIQRAEAEGAGRR